MRKVTVTLTEDEVIEALAHMAREREGLTFLKAKVGVEFEREGDHVTSVDVIFLVADQESG